VTGLIFSKLSAIFLAAGLGWIVGRMRWLGDERQGADPARILSNLAFYLFVPALLFRTTARLDFAALPWRLLAGFFAPLALEFIVIYRWGRRAARAGESVETPAVRSLSASFGNLVQIGIPISAALYGETGLGIHVTIVSLHALILLSIATTFVELDLARARAREAGTGSLFATVRTTVRNTLVHPVTLPVVAGMVWNATDVALPAVIDEVLVLLGSAVAPVCLVLLGVSLAYYGVGGRLRAAIALSVVKLLVLPAVVLAFAYFGLRLSGVPLAIVVLAAAMPTGSNALIFAQRYNTLESETTAAIVISTLAFVVTAPLWVALLQYLK
jgi:malonate transporter